MLDLTPRLAPAALLLLGGLIAACPSNPDVPFPRGGESDDDDDGHGDEHGGEDPESGDRVAYWEVVRTATWTPDAPTYRTRASFFDVQVLGIPRPEGAEECLVNGADFDPFEPPITNEAYGRPAINLDGEDWQLDLLGDYWVRNLPERTWSDFDDGTLLVAGGEAGDAATYPDAISFPESLDGLDIELDDDGLTVEWVSGEPSNQLLLVVKGERLGRTEYVVCTPQDDGLFVIEPETFQDYPVGDVTVQLRRERDREDWSLNGFSRGRTVGVSQIVGSFTITEDTFAPPGN